MEQEFTLSGATLTVRLPGELDHHSAERLRRESDRLIQEKNIKCIIFDFRETSFMDSSGIGMIMGRYRNMGFVGGKVIAAHVNAQVRRILTLSGVHKVIEIQEDTPGRRSV